MLALRSSPAVPDAVCSACASASPETGLLCSACALTVASPEDLIPDHIRCGSQAQGRAWLIDGFGRAYPLLHHRTRIGRSLHNDIAVVHRSVSREHVELLPEGDGWQVRDLGSKNGTMVSERSIMGRSPIAERQVLCVGAVRFLLVTGRAIVAPPPDRSGDTTEVAVRSETFTLQRPSLVLRLITDVGPAQRTGVILYRRCETDSWSELLLPKLEIELLRLLCKQAIGGGALEGKASRCVETSKLARDLPFIAQYANEENVRQVVRRLRQSLEQVGATGLVDSVHGRGYYLACDVKSDGGR